MLFLTLALAAETPTLQGPEPILDLADNDVRLIRRARTSRVVVSLTPVFLVTGIVVIANSDVSGEDAAPVQAFGGLSLGLLGLAGATAGATVLHFSTTRSRRLLEQQGLKPRRLSPLIAPLLIGAGAVTGLASIDVTGTVSNSVVGTIAVSSFAAAVGVSSLQGAWNASARREVGWVVVPTAGSTPGLQVAGRW